MRNKILKSFVILGMCAPPLAAAAQTPVTTRTGSWEFSAGAGIITIDRAFNAGILVPMTIADPDPSRVGFGAAVRLGYNVTSAFGISAGSMFSKANGGNVNSPFVDLTWTPALNSNFSPFLMVGAGVSRFSRGQVHETSSFGMHFGAGLRSMVSSRMALRLEGRMQREQFEELKPSGHQAYNGFATLGLSYFTGGRTQRDTDGDGVADRRDACPGTPAGAIVGANGCPLDSDRDGVSDGIDRCPGTATNVPVDQFGCVRDSDGDNVADNLDRCANTPPNTRVDPSGCPLVTDADNDGVADNVDRCLNTPAAARPVDSTGCPTDSDRDGVADHLDRCPNSPAGSLVEERGCPRDTDSDGVADNLDRCPGTPANARVNTIGCHTIVLPSGAADQMVLRVQFVTNRSALVPASTAILDSVAVAILASPGSEWEVQGFTDIRGTRRANQILSQARAQAVVDYLVTKGVPRASMTATGFASERAVGSNVTAEGQAANRRVQLRRRPAPNPTPLP